MTTDPDPRLSLLKLGTRSAVAGSALWTLAILVLSLELAEALLLVGPLIATPLGLPLCIPRGRHDPVAGRWRRVALLQLPAAVPLVASFAFEPGALAGALAAPWVAFTALVAILGALRVGERGPSPTSELGVDCSLLFLPTGGVWLLASRLGSPFLGFEEPIVFLTAAHFHFAGFTLPLIAGRVARAARGRLSSAMTIGVITGVPLVAIGFSLKLHGILIVELLAALWVCVACVVLVALELRLASRKERALDGLLLTASAVSILVGMGLAGTFSLGAFLDMHWLEIPDMLQIHAPINVFGFSLLGLIYWHRHDRASSVDDGLPAGIAIHVSLLDGRTRPDRSRWETRAFSRSVASGPRLGDACDEHVEAVTSAESFDVIAASIYRFDIFPRETLEGDLGGTSVDVGETIVCRYKVIPGVEMIFACRVTERHDDANERAGLTCRTLEGHPFTGEETFCIERDADDEKLRVVCRSWSRPESLFARLLRPFARRKQRKAARSAVVRLARCDGDTLTDCRRGSATPDRR